MNNSDTQAKAFASLVSAGEVSAEVLAACAEAAKVRQVPLARILHNEHGVSRKALLRALGDYYHRQSIEYDERLPIPPALLRRMLDAKMTDEDWFPVLATVDDDVTVATSDPDDPGLDEVVTEVIRPESHEFRVALPDDIAWYSQDFLHAPPGELIGTERTGLAYWRNTMAQWRTRMACYRTDLAKARTALSMGRAGLAFITISETLWRSGKFQDGEWLPFWVLALGFILLIIAVPIYLEVRRSRMTPPGTQTLVEVTAATLMFLEDFHFQIPSPSASGRIKGTMLARLGDFLADYCTIIYPVPASRERTHLARERNVLAAQRTLAACYRTIYSRARTGLAFIRTGVSCISIGLGLLSYFGLGINTPFDLTLILIGVVLIGDGLLWYLPVRKEQAELPSSRSAVLAAE